MIIPLSLKPTPVNGLVVLIGLVICGYEMLLVKMAKAAFCETLDKNPPITTPAKQGNPARIIGFYQGLPIELQLHRGYISQIPTIRYEVGSDITFSWTRRSMFSVFSGHGSALWEPASDGLNGLVHKGCKTNFQNWLEKHKTLFEALVYQCKLSKMEVKADCIIFNFHRLPKPEKLHHLWRMIDGLRGLVT